MKIAGTTEALIGSTPLVDLTALSDGSATILGKYEATNPGGSVKDAEVIAAADSRGMAMVFTGLRHFRH